MKKTQKAKVALRDKNYPGRTVFREFEAEKVNDYIFITPDILETDFSKGRAIVKINPGLFCLTHKSGYKLVPEWSTLEDMRTGSKKLLKFDIIWRSKKTIMRSKDFNKLLDLLDFTYYENEE